MSDPPRHIDDVLDLESGMMRFAPVLRTTGERLSMEIPYRTFPRTLEYHGIVIEPTTRVRYRIHGKECSIPDCNCDAWAEVVDDAAMEDFFPNPEHDWWSVQVDYPADVQAAIDDYEKQHPDDAAIFFVHGKLWKTRNRSITRVERELDFRSELYPSIQEMERGEGIPMEEAMESIRRELPKRMAELDDIEKGNLPLPEKLYAFVLEQVDSSTFASATDFVAATVRSPKEIAERTLSGRWEHIVHDRRLNDGNE